MENSGSPSMVRLLAINVILFLVNAQENVHPDVIAVVEVKVGVSPRPRWASSYSEGDSCYCLPSDSNMDNFVVETTRGWMTTTEVCDLVGPGPGRRGRPVYNDIQCGNGPASTEKNELLCPGRIDVRNYERFGLCTCRTETRKIWLGLCFFLLLFLQIGESGCGHTGPKWNLVGANASPPMTLPRSGDTHPDIVTIVNVVGGVIPGGKSWADSYSANGRCYCASSFDHKFANHILETPLGWLPIRRICELIGPGPGIAGNPVYNDVQCGNGPPKAVQHEHACPGRTDVS